MVQPSQEEDKVTPSTSEGGRVEKTKPAPKSLKIRTGDPDQEGVGSQIVEERRSPHYRHLRISDADASGQFTPFSHFHRTGASGRSPQGHRRFARSPNFAQRTPAPSNAFEWSKESIFTPLNRARNRHFGRHGEYPESFPRTPQGQYPSTPNLGRPGPVYPTGIPLGFQGAAQDFNDSTDHTTGMPANHLQMLYGQHNASAHHHSQTSPYLPGTMYSPPAWENTAAFTGNIVDAASYFPPPQGTWSGTSLMLPNLVSMMSIQNQMIQQQIRDTERNIILQTGETGTHFRIKSHAHPAKVGQRIRLENGMAACDEDQRLETTDGELKRTPHVPEEDILRYADEHKQGNIDGTFSDFSGRKLKPGGNSKANWKLTARQRRTHKRHMLAEWSRLHAEVPEVMKSRFTQEHILEEIAQMKIVADTNRTHSPQQIDSVSTAVSDVKAAMKVLERLCVPEDGNGGSGSSEEAEAQASPDPSDECPNGSEQLAPFLTATNQGGGERLQTVEEESEAVGDPVNANLDDSVSSTPSTPQITETKPIPDFDGSDKG